VLSSAAFGATPAEDWTMRLSAAALLLLLASLAAGPAIGADGVIEINQAAAEAGGITAGDAPGFPVTLSRSGSYRLTSNLASSSKANSLVRITAPRVTLDLGGFTLSYCPQEFCGTGEENGIDADELDATIRNGNVIGAGGTCVRVGDQARVESVRAIDCGRDGISVRKGEVVGAIVRNAARYGIYVIGGGAVRASAITDGDDYAVAMTYAALIEDTVIRSNAGAIAVVMGSSGLEKPGYRGCHITLNDGFEEVQPISADVRNLGGNLCGSDTVCP
jgi:hypothetical protein